MTRKEELKAQILELTREYYNTVHAPKKEFTPGKTHVNYGGRYFDDKEVVNLVDSSLDFWLTAGPWANKFEQRLAEWLGVKYWQLPTPARLPTSLLSIPLLLQNLAIVPSLLDLTLEDLELMKRNNKLLGDCPKTIAT